MGKFSELVHTKIATFLIFAGHGLQYTKYPAVQKLGSFSRIPLIELGKNVGFGDSIIVAKVGQNILLPSSYFDPLPKGHLTLIYAYLFSDLM